MGAQSAKKFPRSYDEWLFGEMFDIFRNGTGIIIAFFGNNFVFSGVPDYKAI